jgi:hypothetical protein
MANKTAMQELMEWMIEESQVIPVDAEECYNKAEELLAKEENQIKDAFVGCWTSNVPDGIECKVSADEYYNETYGN